MSSMNGNQEHAVPAPRSRGIGDHADALLHQLDTVSDQDRQKLCDEIITTTLPVADRLAARYRGRGIPDDDLRQVARTALVQAMRRFYGAGEQSFLAYAVPCIRGELRRYFRDAGWMVRPPRSIQEARLAINECQADLRQVLAREPSVEEVAAQAGLPAETVRDAQEVGHCFRPESLDRPAGGEATDATIGDSVGASDEGFQQAEARVLIRPLLNDLEPRDKRLVILRFFEGLTQREVGRRIGISQVQVSRSESRILRGFRQALAA